MGSSKKHKERDRDGKKKKKHRSRSRSPSEKKRKRRDRSRSPLRQRDRDEFLQKDYYDYPPDDRNEPYYDNEHQSQVQTHITAAPPSMPPSSSVDSGGNDYGQGNSQQAAENSGEGLSLSIEETNRLRAKLGLKPLDAPGAKGDDGKPKKTEGVHAPAINMGKQKKTEILREKMATKKEQRKLESKLKKVKGLGDSDSDEDAAAWVMKSRKIQRERELAEKRAKMLEEMDEDFGIGDLMEKEFKREEKHYSASDLSGLKVEHAMDKFEEGRNVILTLKDKGVLDDDEDDVLVNVNIEDDERAEKNVDNKKKKPEYKPYDEPQYDEYGMMRPTNMLSKYDEEIEGVKKESFTLGSAGVYDAAHEKRMAEIRQQLRAQGQSLQLAAPQLASEYMTKEEVEAATFKRVKKKVRKIRKKDTVLKADDLLPLADQSTAEDYGSRMRGRGRVEAVEDGEIPVDDPTELKAEAPDAAFSTDLYLYQQQQQQDQPSGMPMDLDDSDVVGPDEDLTGVAVEEEEVQNELHGMLAKARRLKLKKERSAARDMIEQIQPDAEEDTERPQQRQKQQPGVNIILNSTSEFCRNLGEIPTYGLAGNREEDRDEILDMELELMEQRRRQEEQEETTGGWNEVEIDENPVDIKVEDASVLEEEPIATAGVGAALKLAVKKGYIESSDPQKMPTMSSSYLELQAQNYTIQDKRYDDLDEKNRKRDRYQGGMITEFKEKDSYKPDVKLEYVDESGRNMSQKEAFRQLSHRFHGKGSGKRKTEKRSKKVEEELLMKRMSSTDTPLNTLSLLQDKQRSEKSPFIVLSGGSRGFTSNTIVKPS